MHFTGCRTTEERSCVLISTPLFWLLSHTYSCSPTQFWNLPFHALPLYHTVHLAGKVVCVYQNSVFPTIFLCIPLSVSLHKQVIKFVNGQWLKAPSISEFMCLAVCLPTMSCLFWLPAWSIYHWQSSDCIVKLSGKCVHSPFAFTILSNAYFRVERSWDVKSFNQIPHFLLIS